MARAVSSVSPIINLHRIDALDLLPKMFEQVWMPSVVLEDLLDARFLGYNVPSPFELPWVEYQDPQITIPAVWVSLDLSSGEVAAIALAFENRDCVVLIDEPIGRQAAAGVGIEYWGTLQILLEAKARGHVPSIIPYLKGLQHSGMWMTSETVQRVLRLADEKDGGEGTLSLLLTDEPAEPSVKEPGKATITPAQKGAEKPATTPQESQSAVPSVPPPVVPPPEASPARQDPELLKEPPSS